jgi:hypothetical protein
LARKPAIAVQPDGAETISAAQAFEEEILAAFCRDTGMKAEIARPLIRPLVEYLMSEYGGTELYVPALTARYKIDEIGQAFAATGDVEFVCQRYSISRRTLYRILGSAKK